MDCGLFTICEKNYQNFLKNFSSPNNISWEFPDFFRCKKSFENFAFLGFPHIFLLQTFWFRILNIMYKVNISSFINIDVFTRSCGEQSRCFYITMKIKEECARFTSVLRNFWKCQGKGEEGDSQKDREFAFVKRRNAIPREVS